ncbi:MAG: acyl carrier protein [Peptococcaceae bacterium]|nr:acyl carrier protein [Peptococcaceae bacterium]MDR2736283.1 acyl carrier protein [Gracilibacteraceae bacterium]
MDIFAKIKELVLTRFSLEDEDISLDTTFDSLGADSLDIVDLIAEIEEEFDIAEIPEEEIKKMNSVGDMVEYLKENH